MINKPVPRYTLTYRFCSGPLQSVSMLQGDALQHRRRPRPSIKGAGEGLALAEALLHGRRSRPCHPPAHVVTAE